MILPAELSRWPASWLELWRERAAIIQFDGKPAKDVVMNEKDPRYAAQRHAAELRAEQDIRKLAKEERNR